MARKILIIGFLLLLVILSALSLQWNRFSDKEAPSGSSVDGRQEITIVHQKNTFQIKQTVYLPKGTYNLHIPPKTELSSCVTAEEAECDWTKRNNSLQKEEGPITLEYKTMAGRINDHYFASQWAIKLEDVKMVDTKINFAEQTLRNGEWFSSGQRIAMKGLKLVDYYKFESQGGAPPLYWEKGTWKKKKLDELYTIYYQGDANKDFGKLKELDFPYEQNPINIIVSKQNQHISSKDFYVINQEKQLTSIIPLSIKESIIQHAHFEPDQRWYADVVASLVTKTAIGSVHSISMFHKLDGFMRPKEQNTFISGFYRLKGVVSAEKLDQLLSRAKGYPIHFFKLNKIEKESYRNLIAYDERPVRFHGSPLHGVECIYDDGKMLFPAAMVFKGLGFTVKNNSDDHEWMIIKGEEHVRLSETGNFLYINGEKYGMLTNPFVHINQSVYIDEGWLKKIFHLSIDKRENSIVISEQ
ncbi:stalk domain-containing protein [Falsibacillus albus]|uniref:Copper amine oxidase-like N-terminal domain-containing protein n=1 Tax=Falsibacillus albus TaxID=2478915 RepID=A0A3L7K060_9BACI|nr:stalk domain-containing protein [Falsibacillus albus]RLQ95854.1 hypothetical protein D9X91_09560 [Falsibacillus albus]